MSKTANYTQCTFTRPNLAGTAHHIHVAWIPSQFAKKGKTLSLQFEEGEWREYQVAEVGSTKPAEIVEGRERDYLNQRGVSDV